MRRDETRGPPGWGAALQPLVWGCPGDTFSWHCLGPPRSPSAGLRLPPLLDSGVQGQGGMRKPGSLILGSQRAGTSFCGTGNNFACIRWFSHL